MKKAFIISLLLSLGLFGHGYAKPQAVPSQPSNTVQAEGENAEMPMPPQDIPANPHNPANGTYLKSIMPDDSELSKANTELLAKNTELTRQVDSLTTQVNVLVQEKSGQLLIYGGIIALFGFVLGFIFAKLTTRQRW